MEILEIVTSKCLNPAQFLTRESMGNLERNCIEQIEIQTKVREDLEEDPLPYGRVLDIDGSSRIVMGKRASGYAIIEAGEIKEKGKLPLNWSVQSCKLYARKRGLDLLVDDVGTIYTDSRYTFGIAHTFGKICQERGYLNSKGKVWHMKV